MKKLINTFILVLGLVFCVSAQQKFEVKGTVKSDKDIVIENATVILKDIANAEETTVTADKDGAYTIPVREGKYVVKFTAPGYAPKTAIVQVIGNTVLDMALVKIQNSKTSRL